MTRKKKVLWNWRQCVESAIRKGACDYSEYENQDIGYADLQIPAKSKEEVK